MSCELGLSSDKSLWAALLLFALAIASSCGSASDAMSPDAQTLRQVSEITAELTNTRQLSPESFGRLRVLAEKYPNSSDIFKVYRSALIAREDWAELDRSMTERLSSLGRDDKLTLAKVKIKLGKFSDSTSILGQIGGGADDVEFHSLVAISFAGIGEDERAASELDLIWEKVITAKRIDDINLRAQLFFRTKQYQRAIETGAIALSIEPENVVANNLTSRSYAALGDTAKAGQFRIATERSHSVTSQDETRKMTMVSLSTKLKSAWSGQRYDEVIAIGEQMLPLAAANERLTIEKFIAESKAKLGR